MSVLRDDPHRLELTLAQLVDVVEHLRRTQAANVRFSGDVLAHGHAVSVRWTEGDALDREGPRLVITGIRRV